MICPECRADNFEGVDVCKNCGQDLTSLDLPVGPDFIRRNLADLPAGESVKVQVGDPVGLAVRRMQSQETDCVLVMRGAVLVGIITPWDILHKVAGAREDLNAVTCGDVMTADPVCLRDDDDVAVALNKMSTGEFRHIPLLQLDTPTTVVTISDVFRHIAPHLA